MSHADKGIVSLLVSFLEGVHTAFAGYGESFSVGKDTVSYLNHLMVMAITIAVIRMAYLLCEIISWRLKSKKEHWFRKF